MRTTSAIRSRRRPGWYGSKKRRKAYETDIHQRATDQEHGAIQGGGRGGPREGRDALPEEERRGGTGQPGPVERHHRRTARMNEFIVSVGLKLSATDLTRDERNTIEVEVLQVLNKHAS